MAGQDGNDLREGDPGITPTPLFRVESDDDTQGVSFNQR